MSNETGEACVNIRERAKRERERERALYTYTRGAFAKLLSRGERVRKTDKVRPRLRKAPPPPPPCCAGGERREALFPSLSLSLSLSLSYSGTPGEE